jgi:transcriptional regulator with XRE-family HTH domain
MPLLIGARERRQRTGITSGPFAGKAGYSRAALIAIEAGTRPASIEGAQRIAKVLTELGVPTDLEDLLPNVAEQVAA